jgi:UDP-N-acetylmuramoyl-tripeptide--D-alanyl-D-alanine ligase
MTTPALWTAASAAAATDGRGHRQWHAYGVSIDSRTLATADLFVALRGPNFDGHDFVAEALDKGAAAVVVSRWPDGVAADAPLLLVEDTMAALDALARAARERTKAKVIAVTGSVGKTGTKDALHLALGCQGAASANEGNLNNRIGVPLSLARMPEDTAYGIFEIGMNRAGEIAPLSRLIRPHVAIITTIERVHGEFFGSVAEIADAKAEIFAGMSDGVAVLHRDNAYFAWLAVVAETAGLATVLGFGAHPEATARLIDCELRPASSRVTAVIEERTVTYFLPLPGRHWVMNTLAALAAVDAVGADVAEGAAALARLNAPKGRGQRHRVLLSDGGFELFDEAYNASPASMRAAFSVLAGARPGRGGRRIAVLGDMLELGPDAPRLHAALASELAAAEVELVFTAGPHMAQLRDALPETMRGGHAASAEDLVPRIVGAVRPGDVITVKGSLGSAMAVIVDALLAMDSAPLRAANSC